MLHEKITRNENSIYSSVGGLELIQWGGLLLDATWTKEDQFDFHFQIFYS